MIMILQQLVYHDDLQQCIMMFLHQCIMMTIQQCIPAVTDLGR